MEITEEETATADDVDVIDFTENVTFCVRDPGDIVANLDVPKDDDADADDDDLEADPDPGDGENDSTPRKKESGIQQEYLREVHDRLKYELSGRMKVLEEPWLLNHLKVNGFWVRKEQGPTIAKKLKIKVYHAVYYRSIKVWLPEEMWKGRPMPFCPTCKSDRLNFVVGPTADVQSGWRFMRHHCW